MNAAAIVTVSEVRDLTNLLNIKNQAIQGDAALFYV
jgi:hypothetical protein